MITEQIYSWQGAELPMWTFERWEDLENFVDDFCPEEYIATIQYELQPEITGLVFSKEPQEPANAVAAYIITEPGDGPEIDHSHHTHN